jgi:NTP pyrophosphatase (non-canonical NTP hydrolase)
MTGDPIRPAHYRAVTADGIELQAVDVSEAFGLNHHKATAWEYIARAGKKASQREEVDIAKARWWLDRELDRLAAVNGTDPADCEDEEPDSPEGDTAQATDVVIAQVRYELLRATLKHPPIRSAHEGYAIIAEELAELFDEIRRKEPDREAMRKEAIQLAAMAVRFCRDLLDVEP